MTEIFKAPIEKKRKPIEIKKDKVIVMGVELPRNPEPGPRTPPAEKFKDFVDGGVVMSIAQRRLPVYKKILEENKKKWMIKEF
ncbi:MAG: hypothetical protein ACO2O4_00750, partial [Minisyncoccia bacterium]